MRAHLRKDPLVPNDIGRIQRKWQGFPRPKYGAEVNDDSRMGEGEAGIEAFLRTFRFRSDSLKSQ